MLIIRLDYIGPFIDHYFSYVKISNIFWVMILKYQQLEKFMLLLTLRTPLVS